MKISKLKGYDKAISKYQEKRLKLTKPNIKKLLICIAETVAQRKVFSTAEGFAIDSNARIESSISHYNIGYEDGFNDGTVCGYDSYKSDNPSLFQSGRNDNTGDVIHSSIEPITESFMEVLPYKHPSLFQKFYQWCVKGSN